MGFNFTATFAAVRRKVKDPPSQNKENMTWYYAQGDQRQGPISDSELDALIAAGTVNENTLVWKEGMTNWTPLKEARPAGAPSAEVPAGWIKCTSTGRYFPPEEIVYLDGKPYSAAAKGAVLQGVMQTGTLPANESERNGPPWEDRQQLGIPPALWQTIRSVLLEPTETFSKMRREGGIGNPMAYYVILGWVSGLAQLAYQFLTHTGFATLGKTPNPILEMMSSSTFMVVWAVFMPAFIALGSFIGSGILHLSLLICQGAKQPFETTYRSYAYVRGSSAALFLLPVPLLGLLPVPSLGQTVSTIWAFGCGIWGLICICIAIARTHEITTGRAVLAVFLPLIVCCVGLVLFGVMFGFAAVFAGQAGHQ